jgi:hypothetical protein
MDLSIIRWDGRIDFRFGITRTELAFNWTEAPNTDRNQIKNCGLDFIAMTLILDSQENYDESQKAQYEREEERVLED